MSRRKWMPPPSGDVRVSSALGSEDALRRPANIPDLAGGNAREVMAVITSPIQRTRRPSKIEPNHAEDHAEANLKEEDPLVQGLF
ncbi:hypothetical protein VNO77_04210 [Canavalia gladiata]|uniref:Uncharacterized protein n=1 Tax=Canavalia gladiata TaxID=3824 RepID=A0AAN9MW44_CANGL